MDHFIDQIEIKNFKSIRDLKLTGFKRINLFIGRPNVGKSNLLEALSMFCLPFFWAQNEDLTKLIRFSRSRELFYEGNVKRICSNSVRIADYFIDCIIKFDPPEGLKISIEKTAGLNSSYTSTHYEIEEAHYYPTQIEHKGNYQSIIKPYYFKTYEPKNALGYPFLLPPFGDNLYDTLELLMDLRKTFAQWFKQYGLRLVIDTTTQSLKIQKDKGDEVFQLPYSSVADTLQRIIFYKTAIASNENSVLLFEEPEAHAYPPYISEFTQEVIGSTTNQTFIVTHSPLIVNDMLDNVIDDLAIFMVDFKDGQTVARPLTHDELHEVRKFGVDLFFNGESYPV